MEAYGDAKKNIFRRQSSLQYTVLNYDDPVVREWAAESQGQICYFSRKTVLPQGIFMQNGNFVIKWNNTTKVVCNVDELQLFGGHNEENVLAAIACGFFAGVEHIAHERGVRLKLPRGNAAERAHQSRLAHKAVRRADDVEGARVEHRRSDLQVQKAGVIHQNAAPFAARYFELHNNMPNADGSFQSDIVFADGSVRGTLTNGTAYDLGDAALLIYGKAIRIGRLDAGASIDLGSCETINVPVGDSRKIAASVTIGGWQSFLRYYLMNSLNGYFSDARIVGCVREENPEKQPLDFTEQTDIDSYGFTMVVSSLPFSTRVGDVYSYSALSTDPQIQSGDYDATENTVASAWPTTLEYHLGEGSDITSLTIESLSAEDAGEAKSIGSVRPFRGSMSFYNYTTRLLTIRLKK